MCRRLLAFLFALCAPYSTLAAEPEPKGPPEFAALKYRNVGPYAGGRARQPRERRTGRPADVLRRDRLRRRVEVIRRRPQLEAHLRRSADQLYR